METAGRITANHEFTRPMSANIRNSGIIVAANGIMIASSRTAISRSLALVW